MSSCLQASASSVCHWASWHSDGQAASESVADATKRQLSSPSAQSRELHVHKVLDLQMDQQPLEVMDAGAIKVVAFAVQ